MRKKPTKKATSPRHKRALLSEYDFSAGIRGKYADRFAQGTNIVKLDPEIARHFPSSRAVNQALRSVIQQDTK